MKTKLTKMARMCAIAVAVVTLFGAKPALALSGDGNTFENCNGRYTIHTKTWGKAKMRVYGCSNGYVFTHVSSSTNWGKGAGIVRYTPFNERYTSTTGSARYATTTGMLKYPTRSCYKASGWSMDSSSGKTVTYKWCR